jgi:hypothetical protein
VLSKKYLAFSLSLPMTNKSDYQMLINMYICIWWNQITAALDLSWPGWEMGDLERHNDLWSTRRNRNRIVVDFQIQIRKDLPKKRFLVARIVTTQEILGHKYDRKVHDKEIQSKYTQSKKMGIF